MIVQRVSRRTGLETLRREIRMRRYRQFLLLSTELQDPGDPLSKYDSHEFEEIYRFSKESFCELLAMIQSDIERTDNRGRPLPAVYQLLIALHFYCSGSYQKVVGDQHGLQVSQPTVCRTIHRVSEALAKRYSQFITFPSVAEAADIHAKFYEVAQFPNVIGAIDCIHMRISNPGGAMAEQCKNSKGWYSVNCQVVVGPDLKILTAIVRWGGSVPDWQIYDNSRLKQVLEQGEYGHLVGDSAYQCQRYLLTPVTNPTTQAEKCYNRAHSSTRRKVKRVFGMVKRRFPCTNQELRSNPKTSCAIILSCFALHNFALERQGLPDDSEAIYAPDDGPQDRYTGDYDPEGESYRQHIIYEWFSSDTQSVAFQQEDGLCDSQQSW
ncbi:putative nuclease HARBI1 [Macrobrachium rosenbergii]|uniref:putative nuclease HARBI1 n=1 Tax=Macrobrachium rosenbergii TaxID=79674 RepID=UPI0034D6FBB0